MPALSSAVYWEYVKTSEYLTHRATARLPSLCILTKVSVRYAVHVVYVDCGRL